MMRYFAVLCHAVLHIQYVYSQSKPTGVTQYIAYIGFPGSYYIANNNKNNNGQASNYITVELQVREMANAMSIHKGGAPHGAMAGGCTIP